MIHPNTPVEPIKCSGCSQEFVSSAPLIIHADPTEYWHQACLNIFKSWNISRSGALETLKAECTIAKSFDCLETYEETLNQVWTVLNEFEASLITNYLILKRRLLKPPKDTLTIECCSVLLEHTHELLRTAERLYPSRTACMRASVEQLYDLNSSIINFLSEITHTETISPTSLNRLRVRLKESMYEIQELFRMVLMGILVEPYANIQYFLALLNTRTYNLALKPTLLPFNCARTLETDALAVQNIKWRHSVIELNRRHSFSPYFYGQQYGTIDPYYYEQQDDKINAHFFEQENCGIYPVGQDYKEENPEPLILRRISRRRSLPTLEFRKGSTVIEPTTYVSENDFIQAPAGTDTKSDSSASKQHMYAESDDTISVAPKPVRIPHSVFAPTTIPPQPVVPEQREHTMYRRISSLQILSDTDSGVALSTGSKSQTNSTLSISSTPNPKPRHGKGFKSFFRRIHGLLSNLNFLDRF